MESGLTQVLDHSDRDFRMMKSDLTFKRTLNILQQIWLTRESKSLNFSPFFIVCDINMDGISIEIADK
jgi:hypothetical protein